eukprot:CAMPEP_0198276998 /NCGR_PEP_ID=MMETSP1447-20131203/65614_1 /TAXON_ID=420782 /ORGANISM="Chaetoceros dichaeta, Strain CCMP1751" /LENGTH=417 /DNA_ID=CAMNT_0043971987 /DNA_START=70 /DNA_END=1324 /DNA_ORIENTATION=-
MSTTIISSERPHADDDLKWLRDCDKLKDSKGQSLLPMKVGREIPIEDGEIVVILDEFIKKSSASENVVKEIQVILSETIFCTMMDISKMFDGGGLMHDAFEKIDLKIMRMAVKVKFLCYTVMGKLFSSTRKKWKGRREFLVEICCSVLCGLPKQLSALPHHDSDPAKVMKHHKAKDYLARVSMYLWKDFLCRNHVPIVPEVLVPLLRKLAMLDILDANWNTVGAWGDIVRHIEMQCNVRIGRVPADKVLNEKTILLHDGRDSMYCKQMKLAQKPGSVDNNILHCWELQQKCSSPCCSNIETKERPHKLRCQDCFYFHWCSTACRDYCCKFTNIHSYLCKDTPPDKKESLKRQVKAFLSDDGMEELLGNDDACAACGAHKDEFEITLKGVVTVAVLIIARKFVSNGIGLMGGIGKRAE